MKSKTDHIPRKSETTKEPGASKAASAGSASDTKKAKWSPSKSHKKSRHHKKKNSNNGKSMHVSGSSRVFTTAATNGTMITFVKKPKAEEAAVIYPITMKMRKHGSIMNNMMVDFIADRRNTDGSNEPMFQSDNSSYSWICFVTVFNDPKENTAENRKMIVTQHMLPIMNDIGKDVNPIRKEKYNFFNSFACVGDTAPQVLREPSHYLLDHDVVKIIEKVYPSMTLTELAQDDKIVASFYGSNRVDEGRAIMTSIDNESEASSVEESSNDEH